MPTPATVLDNALRHIGAAIYIAVFLFLVGFLIRETYIQVKFELKRRKEKKECLNMSKETL